MAVAEVHTGCRIHFGLIELAEHQACRFAGLGLGLSTPGVSVKASCDTLLGARTSSQKAPACTVSLPENTDHTREYQLRVEQAFQHAIAHLPPDVNHSRHSGISSPVHFDFACLLPLHSGLGAGTQLGVAVATAVQALLAPRHVLAANAAELAHRSGRGKRSAIGLETFLRGGLVFDHGVGTAVERGYRCTVRNLPSNWHVVLVTPDGEDRVAGDRESKLLAEIARQPNPLADEMLCIAQKIIDELAGVEVDFFTFTDLLERYMWCAAQPFAPVQNGVFNGRQVAEAADVCESQGLRAVGQSSWGPTVFGFAATLELANQAREAIANLLPTAGVQTVCPASSGARIVVS